MPPRQAKRGHLKVAVDVGTTSSAVSYVLVPEGTRAKDTSSSAIETVSNYPTCAMAQSGDPMQMKVPTEIIYPQGWNFATPYDSKMGCHMPMNSADDLVANDDEEAYTRPRWGYQVHEALRLPDTHSDASKRPVYHFKTLFGEGKNQARLRKHGEESLRNLHRHTIDRSKFAPKKVLVPVMVDFLTFLLQHAKDEILKQGYEFTGPTEIILCIPHIWGQQSCSDMQDCMAKALGRVCFPGVEVHQNSISKVFLISEPEAAATYLLASGGTVDAIMYTVTGQAPLRLKQEVVQPGGDTCGSTSINQGVRELVYDLIENETYLETNGTTIKGIVEALVCGEFEYLIKRGFRAGIDTPDASPRVTIAGLQGGRHEDFLSAARYIDKLNKIFTRVFEQVAAVMIGQLTEAKKKKSVDKVVLIGGFAAFSYLRDYLRKALDTFNEEHDTTTEWHSIRDVERGVTINAVAVGAVVRALNKENGPERRARSSYGLIRLESKGPEHGKHKGYSNGLTKDEWLNTIQWVIKKDDLIPRNRTVCIDAMTPFSFYDKETGLAFTGPFTCTENIWLSHKANKDHYKRTHKYNRGAVNVGTLEFDVTFLYENGLLRLRTPKRDGDGEEVTELHWEAWYKIMFIIDGFTMQCKLFIGDRIESMVVGY
ncbi:hypothetical protein NW762_010863 [Fusarium torreyae]|uniref:Hsp70 protein n=1 Tax=Fusarium torreyae TaxID=1237075 RepID=A0A9W8RSN0_9HYPO|nr:hypothetical protein NW762_010863 [Fusarium torreyae]